MIKTKTNIRNLFFPLAAVVLGCLVAYGTTGDIFKLTTGAKQKPVKDTIHVIWADETLLRGDSIMELTGNVKLKQGTTLFTSDRAIKNNRLNTFEAWGRVHINDADTTNIYSDHLRYLGNTQMAYLDGNVKLTDGQVTLTTPELEYDMTTNIGIYRKNGKVVNKKTIITSKEGEYYRDIQDVYFKKNVVVTDPAYDIKTDSLRYNTGTQVATFITMTHIKDSARRSIDTREGFYNLKTGQAAFGQNPLIVDEDKKTTLKALNVSLDDNIARAEGNAIVVDSIRGTTIIANLIFQNRVNEAVLATQKPVMIVKQDNDSLYIAADTLFTAKLSDLFEQPPLPYPITTPDSSGPADSNNVQSVSSNSITIRKDPRDTTVAVADKKSKAANDSTDRYFEAFHNVRIYSDSMQAVSDSLFYSFKDSTFRLFKEPVVWGKESQITGDTILLHTKNKQPSWMEAYKNGFMVNYIGSEAYNQIKASRIDAFFIEGNLDSVRAKGSAECIYYLQDDDSAFTGVNQNKCDIIDSYFKDKQLNKVAFRSEVEGTIYPIRQKRPSEMKLEGFTWREALRPKTKYELFE